MDRTSRDSTEAHSLCGFLDHIWQLGEVIDRPAECFKFVDLACQTVLVRRDGDGTRRCWCATQADLLRISDLSFFLMMQILTSVAKRVHKFSFRGNGISVMASSTELLPDDWSPHTTNCGSSTMPLRPVRRSLSTMSITLRWSADCKACKELVVTASSSMTIGLMSLSMMMCSDAVNSNWIRAKWC
jgi:hypothetical protein